MHVDCDNSHCDKAVSNFRVALERSHTLKSDDGHNKLFNYRVVQTEYPGIPKNSSGTFSFKFVIPTEVIDAMNGAIAKAFKPTCITAHFAVGYNLIVWLHHDSWNDDGGQKFRCPVEIRQSAITYLRQ